MKRTFILILFVFCCARSHSRNHPFNPLINRYHSVISNLQNHPPTGADATINALEDVNYIVTLSDFGYIDPLDEPPNAFMAVKITTLPLNGTLKLSNVNVVVGQFIVVADISATNLRYFPVPNASGNAVASFTFQVQDDGGIANGGVDLDPVPNTMTFNLTPVNDPPAGTDKTISINEDVVYAFTAADFGFSDPIDVPPNTLLNVQVTSLPVSGLLKVNGVNVTLNQFVSVANINSALFTFTPPANISGSLGSFTFKVQDNGGTSNGGINLDPTPNTISFNVLALNDAPLGADKSISILEDNSYTFVTGDFGFTDPNDSPPNTFLNVQVISLPAQGSLIVNGVGVTMNQFISVTNINSALFRFIPPVNLNGTQGSFTFKVQDNGGTISGGIDLDPVANTINFNITPVNDAPSFLIGPNLAVCKNSAAQSAVAWCTLLNDGDAEVVQALSFVVTNDNNALFTVQPAVNASGDLTYTPAPNVSGNATVSVKITDNGGTANGGINESAIQTAVISIKPESGWVGKLSSDWFVAANWCASVPTATSNVIIYPAPFQPVISGANAICSHITITPTSSLNIVAPQMLTVTGN